MRPFSSAAAAFCAASFLSLSSRCAPIAPPSRPPASPRGHDPARAAARDRGDAGAGRGAPEAPEHGLRVLARHVRQRGARERRQGDQHEERGRNSGRVGHQVLRGRIPHSTTDSVVCSESFRHGPLRRLLKRRWRSGVAWDPGRRLLVVPVNTFVHMVKLRKVSDEGSAPARRSRDRAGRPLRRGLPARGLRDGVRPAVSPRDAC